MKNLEVNKILGALLFVAFIILFSTNAVNVIYSSITGIDEHSAEPEDIGGDIGSNGTTETILEKNFDIPELMKLADVTRGQTIAKKCASCHTFGKGEPNRVGPNLYGIVGNKIAHMPGFNYSQAVKDHGGNWDKDSLFHWINNPKKFIPGNRMAFVGVSKDSDIADLVAYLESLN